MPLAPIRMIRVRSALTTVRLVAFLTLLAWVIQPAQLYYASPTPALTAEAPEVPPSWISDIAADATPSPPGGRVVTGMLLTGQKPAKGGECNHEDQTAIGKGCWVELAKKPKPPPILCGDYYEHKGHCFAPVLQAKVPNTIRE